MTKRTVGIPEEGHFIGVGGIEKLVDFRGEELEIDALETGYLVTAYHYSQEEKKKVRTSRRYAIDTGDKLVSAVQFWVTKQEQKS